MVVGVHGVEVGVVVRAEAGATVRLLGAPHPHGDKLEVWQVDVDGCMFDGPLKGRPALVRAKLVQFSVS